MLSRVDSVAVLEANAVKVTEVEAETVAAVVLAVAVLRDN